MKTKMKWILSLLILQITLDASSQEHRQGPSPEKMAAVKQCFADQGITLQERQRPDLSQLSGKQLGEIKQCLAPYGIEFPPRHQGRPPGPPPEQFRTSAPASGGAQ